MFFLTNPDLADILGDTDFDFLEFGSLDLLAGATQTPENKKHFIFSPAVSSAKVTVFTKRNSELVLKSRDDLKSLKGVKLIGMSFGDDLSNFVLNQLVVEDTISLESVFRMLQFGRADYAIAYEKAGLKFIEKLGLGDVLKSQPLSLESNSIHILASPYNHCLNRIAPLFDQINILKSSDDRKAVLGEYTLDLSRKSGVPSEI